MLISLDYIMQLYSI